MAKRKKMHFPFSTTGSTAMLCGWLVDAEQVSVSRQAFVDAYTAGDACLRCWKWFESGV